MSNAEATGRRDENSAAQSLRNEIFAKVSSILRETEGIENSVTRLAIQGACLDLVVSLEEVISGYSLEALNDSAVS